MIGALAIFRETYYGLQPDKYGLFRIVRETPARFYFEHVAGDPLRRRVVRDVYKPGSAFNFHNEYWLDKHAAKLKAVEWIVDESVFEAVVEAHKQMCERFDEIDRRAREIKSRMRDGYNGRVGNMVLPQPEGIEDEDFA